MSHLQCESSMRHRRSNQTLLVHVLYVHRKNERIFEDASTKMYLPIMCGEVRGGQKERTSMKVVHIFAKLYTICGILVETRVRTS